MPISRDMDAQAHAAQLAASGCFDRIDRREIQWVLLCRKGHWVLEILARTLVRRAERRVVALSHGETVNPAVIRYLNRLSDHLFVLGRHVNDNGAADVQWVPGANR